MKYHFLMSTSGSFTMLRSPGLRSDLGFQLISTQCFSPYLQSIDRESRVTLYPRCCPRRKDTILRTTQMIQPCLTYCNNSVILFSSPYSSQRQTESPVVAAPNRLPLCRMTHLNHVHFYLLINIRHSVGS